jgi:subtilisin family serine protease
MSRASTRCGNAWRRREVPIALETAALKGIQSNIRRSILEPQITRQITTRQLSIFVCLLLATVQAWAGDGQISRSPNPYPGSYLIRLREDIPLSPEAIASELAAKTGARITHVHGTLIKGFSIRGNDEIARAISLDPRVARVSEDGIVRAQYVQSPAPSWGLDRIDQINLADSDGDYTYYYWAANVMIYIIDTGMSAHPDYAGRVLRSRNFMTNASGVVDPNDYSDCTNHGTGVASIAAGTTYGVAKVHILQISGCSIVKTNPPSAPWSMRSTG